MPSSSSWTSSAVVRRTGSWSQEVPDDLLDRLHEALLAAVERRAHVGLRSLPRGALLDVRAVLGGRADLGGQLADVGADAVLEEPGVDRGERLGVASMSWAVFAIARPGLRGDARRAPCRGRRRGG
jgi:hypothetical protein